VTAPTPEEYQARIAEARARLIGLLDPQTQQERQLVAVLCDHLSLQELTVLGELIEYGHSH
jgi:hypothetical protein